MTPLLHSTSPSLSRDRLRWQIFATCAVAIFFVWLDSTSMPAMLPVFRSLWPEASAQELAWVLNAYSISFALLLVPMGWVSDRLGSLKLLKGGLVLYGMTSTICACTTSLEVTIAARMAQGIAAASLPPSALSLALRNLPVAQHGRAMYFWAAVGGIAAILGPLAAGIALNGGYALFYGLHDMARTAVLVALHRLGSRIDQAAPRRLGDPAASWLDIRRPGFLFLQLGTLFLAARSR